MTQTVKSRISQLLKKMFDVWSNAAKWANTNMNEVIDILARPSGAGGAGLPKPVLQSQLVANRTLRWEIVKASDIRNELFKEFEAYVEVGALSKLPDDGIIYTGL